MKKKDLIKVISLVLFLILLCAVAGSLCGCRQADRVAYNLGREADSFNIMRKLTVMNARTDTIMLELTGRFSLSNNSSKELEVVIEYDKGCYKKNFIYLTDNVLYVVEDLSGADVSPYQYEITFLPAMVPLVDFDVNLEGIVE